MKSYYVKTFNGSVVGAPILLETADPIVQKMAMLPCPNFSDFDPLTKKIKSRSIVNNAVVYEYDDFTPSVESLSLEKKKKKQEIEASFYAEPDNGCMTSLNINMDCQRKDIEDMKSLLLIMQTTQMSSIDITDHFFNTHTFTAGQINQVLVELIAHGMELYQRKWTLWRMIDACSTVADVRAINWSTQIGN